MFIYLKVGLSFDTIRNKHETSFINAIGTRLRETATVATLQLAGEYILETLQSRREPETLWNKSYLCIIIANFMLCVGHASVNPLVATYTKYLDTTPEMTGFLTGMFFAVAFLFHPFAGPAMTKLDKRKLLIWVFLVGAVANIGYALFHNVPLFIFFRFFSGIQYSLVGPLLMALSGDHIPREKMTVGLGIYGIGGAIGNAIAPTLGATILDFGTKLNGERTGYTLMFIFGAIIFVLATIPTALIAPDTKTREEIASTGAWYKNIFTIHALPPGIAMLLLMTSYSLINTYIFEFTKEQSIAGASVFYLVLAAALAISRPFSGYITGKLGMTRIVFPALAIFACAMLAIGFSRSLWMVLLGAILAAVGFGSSQPSLQAMTLLSEPSLRRGVATNTMYMGMDMGLFLGPFLGGFVYARSDYSFMYKAGVVPIVLAIVCMVIIIPIHKKRLEELGN